MDIRIKAILKRMRDDRLLECKGCPCVSKCRVAKEASRKQKTGLRSIKKDKNYLIYPHIGVAGLAHCAAMLRQHLIDLVVPESRGIKID